MNEDFLIPLFFNSDSHDSSILLDIKKKSIMLGLVFCFCNGIFYFHNPVKYSFLRGKIKEDLSGYKNSII